MIDIISKHIDKVLDLDRQIIIAIDGKCASGKTTLANNLSEKYDCNIFHMDDFFLRREQRTDKRYAEIGGNVDYERFKIEIMDNLNKYINFSYRPFSCQTMSLGNEILVKAKKINIVEGAYCLHPTLINMYDLKIFLSISEDIQKERILKRNGAKMLDKFTSEWIPLENKYFKELKIKDKCELVFNTDLI